MSFPEVLIERGHAIAADAENLSAQVGDTHCLLFFPGDVRRFPESSDLVVILPELHTFFKHAFELAVVLPEQEQALAQQFGVTHWPSLVMLKAGEYVGCIAELQNWAVYCEKIDALLQQAPESPPLPVVS